jgi:SAM-dependent methyltransferase
VDNLPFADGAMDFGYSLGVLHHVPDTQQAFTSCVRKLKPGSPFLLYLSFAFDNRPSWYRLLWRITDLVRRLVARLPFPVKLTLTTLIALVVYYPLARLSFVLEKLGCKVELIPLAYYRKKSFYTMRTDAFDRFATRLEQRFTAQQIQDMMSAAGLCHIRFSSSPPYWCSIGFKAS